MGKRRTKKWPALLIAAAAVAALLIGFGWLDLLMVHPEGADSPAIDRRAALTVRVLPADGTAVYDLAAGVTVNETPLGSRSGEKRSVPRGTAQADAYDFVFQDGDLPADPLSSVRLDLYAAEKAGVDYTPCGSAVIRHPQTGGVYTLSLNGDFASGLCVALAEAADAEAIDLMDAGI